MKGVPFGMLAGKVSPLSVAVLKPVTRPSLVGTSEKSPSEVYASIFRYAKDAGLQFNVRSSLSLGHKLRALRSALRGYGISFEKPPRTGKGVTWRFGSQKYLGGNSTQPTRPADERGDEGSGEKPANPSQGSTPPSQVKEVNDVKVIDGDYFDKVKKVLQGLARKHQNPSTIQFAFLDLALHLVREGVVGASDEGKKLVGRLRDEGFLKESSTTPGWFTISLGKESGK